MRLERPEPPQPARGTGRVAGGWGAATRAGAGITAAGAVSGAGGAAGMNAGAAATGAGLTIGVTTAGSGVPKSIAFCCATICEIVACACRCESRNCSCSRADCSCSCARAASVCCESASAAWWAAPWPVLGGVGSVGRSDMAFPGGVDGLRRSAGTMAGLGGVAGRAGLGWTEFAPLTGTVWPGLGSAAGRQRPPASQAATSTA